MQTNTITTLLEKLKQFVTREQILISLMPERFEVSQLAILCGKDNSTIRTHLGNRYEYGVDYFQPNNKKGAKIVIARAVAIEIRTHYAKKEK